MFLVPVVHPEIDQRALIKGMTNKTLDLPAEWRILELLCQSAVGVDFQGYSVKTVIRNHGSEEIPGSNDIPKYYSQRKL